jgi:hypothetical protein
MTQNYDFVEIPSESPRREPLLERNQRSKANLHNRYSEELVSGKLELKFTVQTALTVGSGLMILGSDLATKFKNPKTVKRLEKEGAVQSVLQTENRLVIPGSSLKGVVRSIYESITHSCLCKIDKGYELNIEKDFLECQVNPRRNHFRVCPACRIFGAMGYLGLVHFSDALCDRTGFALSTMPTLNSPQPNARIPGAGSIYFVEGVEIKNKKGKISDKRLRGRKFYPHTKDSTRKGNIPVQAALKGYTFTGQVRFTNLSKAETGALLIALGQDEQYPFALKMGGGKAVGKGTVTVEIEGIDEIQDLKGRYSNYALPDLNHQKDEALRNLIRNRVKLARRNGDLIQIQQLEALSSILKWTADD